MEKTTQPSGPKFQIEAQIKGKRVPLTVTPLDTSDGSPYFSCALNRKEITQIRKETYGQWEQLWGDLDIETVQELGEQIAEKIQPSSRA